MSFPLLGLTLAYERDIVLARQRARQLAAELGFDRQDQTRIGTAVSEIARNAFSYGKGGKVEFSIEGKTAPQVLLIRIEDRGPGIAELKRVLEGSYRSPHGMGVGIIGTRRLMDGFDIRSRPGEGTTVVLKKLLPPARPVIDEAAVARVTESIRRERPRDAVEEVQRQNQELLQTLDELRRRQEELARLNRELDDTNRGVVALYAELDEKADHLRRADEIKTRFISNMSHEFRTPVNSIQALAKLLLERMDGELTPEQDRQVSFIRQAADALAELVSDLLDLAKVEAGKTEVRPSEFKVSGLFGALRGMLRPLLVGDTVRLVFEEPETLPTLFTDEGKVSQILRNLVSNALKFTEAGEVRVSARHDPATGRVQFIVVDTGIGIAPEDRERIFQEFTQVDSPVQRRVRGTGLGLPLCRRLAVLLGGSVTVSSESGVGSTFVAEIPAVYEPPRDFVLHDWPEASERIPVLVVEDRAEALLLYEKYVSGSPYALLGARSLREARQALARVRPRAVLLDILLPGEDGWSLLTELKRADGTRDIPVVILTTVEDRSKGLALGADDYLQKPIDRATLLAVLARHVSPEAVRRVLVVDDDEISRYLLKQSLPPTACAVIEASGGDAALTLARNESPSIIFLDLVIPGMDGFEVLRRLAEDERTREVPVVVLSSLAVDPGDPRLRHAAEVMRKEQVSPERIRTVLDQLTVGGRS